MYVLITLLAACGDAITLPDGLGSSAEDKSIDRDGDGYAPESSGGDDCDDTDASINPAALELCDEVDNDCDSAVDDDDTNRVGRWWGPDFDGDEWVDSLGAVTACDVHSLDGVLEKLDVDTAELDSWIEIPEAQYGSDGTLAYPDCDDEDADVFPGATETCNSIDDDCNGSIDDGTGSPTTWWADADSDGYGDAAATVEECDAPEGYVDNDGDCDDTTTDVNPDAVEMCDAIDNNCDGATDGTDAADVTTWYLDQDSDGYGDSSTYDACELPPGYVGVDGDCDDTDASINPAATETCNSVDDDCNGSVDDGSGEPGTWYRDADSDGYGDASRDWSSCTSPSGYAGNDDDCDDTDASINPGATETFNSVDDDCDGTTDEDVMCATEVTVLNDMGDASGGIYAFATDSSYSGWWWDSSSDASSVAAVTAVETNLGGLYRQYEFTMDMCFQEGVTEVQVFGVFSSGDLCEVGGMGALVDGISDGDVLDVLEVDYDEDGDGVDDACYYSIVK